MALRMRSVAGVHAVLSLALTSLLATGCERTPPPEFEPAEATKKLIPEVRKGMTAKNEEGQTVDFPGVTETVRSHFGTLAEPKVWPILPIDFGGTQTVVTEVISPSEEEADAAQDAERPIETVTLVLAAEEGEKLSPLPKNAIAGWKEGQYEGKLAEVAKFEPQTGRITLTGTFDHGLPEVKDILLLNPGSMLAKGQALYNRHCMHCHGAGGAGDGPTARYLQPEPRDFRLGLYKFTSTNRPDKPSHADLERTLREGIPGTSMPAFRMLPEQEMHAIIAYTLWLSMRGEYESLLAQMAAGVYEFTDEVYDERIADGETREEILEEVVEYLEFELPDDPSGEDIAEAWAEGNEESALVVPETPRVPNTPESRARGRALYLSTRAQCASCHGPYGKGDGPQTVVFTQNVRTDETNPTPGLYDDWGDPIQPRDLTRGIYRGGRRPIDLYRRLYAGIKGTPMPGVGGTLEEQEIWDLVNFVLHVPYEELPEPGAGSAVVSSGH